TSVIRPIPQRKSQIIDWCTSSIDRNTGLPIVSHRVPQDKHELPREKPSVPIGKTPTPPEILNNASALPM
ncbi:MAG: hypothetical protein WCQ41_08090, partial [Bacillota bacterium]